MPCRQLTKSLIKSFRRPFIGLLLLFAGSAFCQDPVFSQYYLAPTHINSAFAGTVAYPNFSAIYRLQWPGLSNAYRTYALSYDQFFRDQNIGIGMSILSDDQGEGTLKTTKLKGIISYNLQFANDWQIKFGIGAGFVSNSLDWNKLIFFDQIDPQFGIVDGFGNPIPTAEIQPNNLNKGYFDLDLGFLLYNPKYYFGLSMAHANSPYAGFLYEGSTGDEIGLPVLLSLQAGYQIVIDKDNKGNPRTFISPNVLYASQSGFNQINIGAYLQRDVIFGGMWIRHTLENIDALIFSAGFNVNGMRISYSFDLTTSNLGLNTTGGSHELGITLGLTKLEKKVSKLNDCLSLFR